MLAAAGLLLLSAILQLAAAASRWLIHPEGLGGSAPMAQDGVYDYFLASEPFAMIPGTSLPFGIGMLLQAAVIVLLAASLHRSMPGTGDSLRRAELLVGFLLGFLAAAGPALIGYHALRIGLAGTAAGIFLLVEPAGLYILAASASALLVLSIIALTRNVWAGIAMCFTVGSTLPGYLVASFLIAPLLAGDTSYDTTAGSEAIVAFSTLAAGLFVLLGCLLGRRRQSAGHLSTPRA
ncbi:hypothetical protein AUR04nite_33460 [Glutamicibacter uratoxydans]|uniref:Integral membrane protein n=2 Tax=Glutamicibacter uratoxydans TaxID=43667 RepID=A0A4Y4DVD9_GLUUR|nr:hypothetical protein AUR04nite_33460 [Glutamicibacter uratoxydans]